MVEYKNTDAASSYEQAVDINPEAYQWNRWSIYPEYKLGTRNGSKYLYAPLTAEQRENRESYYPLSRAFSSLFLRFARWPEEHDMDITPPDTEKNEEVAREWAETYGVLGADPPDLTVLGQSSEAIRFRLGRVGPDGLRGRGSRSEALGGPQETVQRFTDEAWEANMALRLYEAATNSEGIDLDTIASFMPDETDDWVGTSTRELHVRRPESSRRWALTVVEEIVERKVRGHCWPTPVPSGSSHKQGWVFDSLLGAMWLQMLWLMLGQPRRCEYCARLLDAGTEQDMESNAALIMGGKRKPRSDRRFCDNNGRCRQKWNYHHGTGKSSKNARKQQRTRLARKS